MNRNKNTTEENLRSRKQAAQKSADDASHTPKSNMTRRSDWPEDVHFDLSEFDKTDTAQNSTEYYYIQGEGEYHRKPRTYERDYGSIPDFMKRDYMREDPSKKKERKGGEKAAKTAKSSKQAKSANQANRANPAKASASANSSKNSKKPFKNKKKAPAVKKDYNDDYYDDDDLDTESVADARGVSHEERRRKQRKRDAIRLSSIVGSILFIVIGAAVLYRVSIVRTINVTGSELYGDAQLLSLSGIRTGKSLFFYSEQAMRESMNSVADIRTVSVKKHFPNRIDIVVSDLTASAAILSANGNYVLIDDDGYVLRITDELPEDVILIHGMTGVGFSLNTYIDKTSANVRTVSAVRLIKAIQESAIRDKVECIDISSSVSVFLELAGNYRIMLGSITTAHECIDTAARAYERFSPIYTRGGTINVFHNSTTVDFTPDKP